MKPFPIAPAILFLVAGFSLHAQSNLAPSPDKGPYLGVLFGPSNNKTGVVVTHVLPDSPAARAQLRKDDVLLRYGTTPIQNCEHLVRLIQADRPENKIKLSYLRGERENVAEVVVGLGPRLELAGPFPLTTPVRAIAKPGGPPAVTVLATPLEMGRVKLVIEYYDPDKGRYQVIEVLDSEVDVRLRDLPDREQRLVRVALQRIQDRGLPVQPKR